MRPRWAGRRNDANEPELVKVARGLGLKMVRVGEPCDWLAGAAGRWYPVEIKNLKGRAYGRTEQLTKSQRELREISEGCGLPLWIWRSEDDVHDCAFIALSQAGALQAPAASAPSRANGACGGST